MATCPRCYGPLSENHKCRPRWIKRFFFQFLVTTAMALVGILVSTAFWPHQVPVLGITIGGALGYGLSLVTRPD